MDAKTIRETIFSADDLGYKQLSIPEWNVTVYIKKWTARERELWEMRTEKAKWKHTRERLAVDSVFTEDHTPVFTAEDIPTLAGKSAKALDRIFDCALSLNGMKKSELEEAEKNFSETEQEPS